MLTSRQLKLRSGLGSRVARAFCARGRGSGFGDSSVSASRSDCKVPLAVRQVAGLEEAGLEEAGLGEAGLEEADPA